MLTKQELAYTLKVSLPTINRMMVDGCPVIRVRGSIRFDYEEVVEWLKRGGESAESK